jgi:hypothetical protein
VPFFVPLFVLSSARPSIIFTLQLHLMPTIVTFRSLHAKTPTTRQLLEPHVWQA